METVSLTLRTNSRSKPFFVPSRSILVSSISPAPRRQTSSAQAIASMPVLLRPPCVKTSHRFGAVCLASIATTMHCEPYLALASETKSGLATAEEFILTLSAPAFRSRLTSLTSRTPPPTVSGINTWDATSSMICRIKSLPSEVAVISKKVISSAP